MAYYRKKVKRNFVFFLLSRLAGGEGEGLRLFPLIRHPRESRGPASGARHVESGIPACAGMTALAGSAIARRALRVNSLLPVITFHALWDMVQFLGGLWARDFGLLITLGIVVNVSAGAALWWRVLRKRR